MKTGGTVFGVTLVIVFVIVAIVAGAALLG